MHSFPNLALLPASISIALPSLTDRDGAAMYTWWLGSCSGCKLMRLKGHVLLALGVNPLGTTVKSASAFLDQG
jgi:hypothetical protein